MADVCFGPFITKAVNPRVIEGLHSLNIALEFAVPSHSTTAFLYRKIRDKSSNFSRGVGDFFIHEKEIPCEIRYLKVFSVQTRQGLFVPLDDVLLSLYRKFSFARRLLNVLEELREALPDDGEPELQMPKVSLLKEEAAARGYSASIGMPYGRHIDVQVQWAPAQDRFAEKSPLHLTLGRIEFRPRHDFTLGRGRWAQFRREVLGLVLREDIQAVIPGPPVNLLSEYGVQAVIKAFPWSPLSLMTTQEARQARLCFVQQNQELWTDHNQLAQALLKAGLYSTGTGVYHVRKSIPTLIRMALENPGASS